MRDTNEQLQRESLVLRIVWMLAFVVVWHLAEMLLAVVVIAQLGCRLFQGEVNATLLAFGDSLSQYLAQIGRFGSFNSEDKPWPFADWPSPQAPAGQTAADEASGS